MDIKNLRLQDLEDNIQDALTHYRINVEQRSPIFTVKVNVVYKTINITLTRKSQPFHEKIAGKPYEFYWTIIRKVFNQMQIKGFNKLVITANFENIPHYDWERQNGINEGTGKIISTDWDIIKRNFKNSVAVFSALVIATLSISLILSPSFRVLYWEIACTNKIISRDSSNCKK
jgi:hypothetical protein